MKTLHTYLLWQILASLLMTVMVFTLVLLLGNALKEILPLLVSGQVSFGTVGTAIGLLIPFVWIFALPMGMLTATLLIFGRFSADQELTAVRASGISLLSITSPILLLSLALCGVSALVNMEIGPRCRVAYTSMIFNLQAEFSSAQLPEGRFITDFPGYMFYVGKNRKGLLQEVIVFQLKDETNVTWSVRAPRGKLELDPSNQRATLRLYDAKIIDITEGRGGQTSGVLGETTLPLDLKPKARRSTKPQISDMTFEQLWAELNYLERRVSFPLNLKGLTKEQVWNKRVEMAYQRREMVMPVVFQIHRRVAFSFACFGFTLVGIPLGIRMHRRETNIGIAIALLLVAVYYSFILVGSALETKPEYAPHLIVWIPNLLFQAVGAVLLWRANRGI